MGVVVDLLWIFWIWFLLRWVWLGFVASGGLLVAMVVVVGSDIGWICNGVGGGL